MSRANIDAFCKLHNSLMYVCTVKDLKVPLDQLASNVLDPKQLKRYIEFQAIIKATTRIVWTCFGQNHVRLRRKPMGIASCHRS